MVLASISRFVSPVRSKSTGGRNRISRLQTTGDGTAPSLIWQKEIDGTVRRLIAANGHLIAVTKDGKICAFAKTDEPVRHYQNAKESGLSPRKQQIKAATILEKTQAREGYAVIFVYMISTPVLF